MHEDFGHRPNQTNAKFENLASVEYIENRQTIRM